jgi:hypothetical protein
VKIPAPARSEARRHGACEAQRGVALKRHNTAQPDTDRFVRSAIARWVVGIGLAVLAAACTGGPHPLPPFVGDNRATPPPKQEQHAGNGALGAATAGQGVPLISGGGGRSGTGPGSAGRGPAASDASVDCDAAPANMDAGPACSADEDGGVLVP